MDEQKLARAMEAFIRRQISDCENKEPDELRRALRDCGDCRKMINDLLGEDKQHICKELDNSMEHAGEQMRNFYGSTPILVDKGQKGRGTASCNLPATRYIIEANPLNVLKPRAFRFAACIMELIPSQTAFVMRW